jgi:type II secretory ATPase GspE/PulE/Tfp pilus assembly ATPase PilB-like protein
MGGFTEAHSGPRTYYKGSGLKTRSNSVLDRRRRYRISAGAHLADARQSADAGLTRIELLETENQMSHAETLTHSLTTQKIGTLLIKKNVIKAEDLAVALDYQKKNGGKLGEVLVLLKKVTWEQLSSVLEDKFDIDFVDLREVVIDPAAISLVPETMARKHTLMPIETNERTLTIAVAYPDDIRVLNELRALTQKRVLVKLALPKDIIRSIDLYYNVGGEVTRKIKQFTNVNEAIIDELKPSDETPVTQTIQMIIQQGVRNRASDIHFEPQSNRLRVRFRIDGTLIDMFSLPLSVYPALLTRIKIMAEMDIAEQRRPQDGQFSVQVDNRDIDIRVATLVASYGERITMRILDKQVSLYSLSEIGFLADTEASVTDILKSRAGMMLVAGPTGSGKTTTMYACINHLDKNENNIITIEDPIEYKFHNINQTQVNVKAGVTYAGGLRAILRSDPDIVLIGEIRDQETAQISIQAALTGHLLLASIHANDAVSTLFRLLELDIDAYLISTTLIGILSQRMVRRICTYCKTEVEPTAADIMIYEAETHEKVPKLYKGTGCSFCSHTGYLGRTGVFELLVMNEAIRNSLRCQNNYDEIKTIAAQRGMRSLLKDGLLKVKSGLTTISEVMRCLHSVGF